MKAVSPIPVKCGPRAGGGPLLAVLALGLVGLAALTSSTLVACLLPAILLLAVLALGRYPGEDLVRALAPNARGRRRRPARRAISTGRRPHAANPCGAALIAFNRAVRPPPLLLSTR